MISIKDSLRKNHKNFLLIFISILAISPFIITSVFANPAADDFCFSNITQQYGFIDAQIHWYALWTGRFFSTFLLSFNNFLVDFPLIYKIILLLIPISLLIALYFLIREILGSVISKSFTLFFSTVLLLLYFYGMPSLSEGLYWMSGTITYTLPIILSLVLLILLIRITSKKNLPTNHSIRNFIIAGLLLVAIIGCNETIMLVWNGVLFLLLTFNYIYTRELNHKLLVLLLICISFSAIVILAPGNSIRSGYYSSTIIHNIQFSIVESFIDTLKFIYGWLINTPILLITIIAISVYPRIRNSSTQVRMHINPVIALIVSFILIQASIFISYWSIGELPLARTLNVSYFIFILGWFFTWNSIVQYLMKRNITFPNLPIYCIILIFAVFIISFTHSTNITNTINDIVSKSVLRFDRQMQQRKADILTCKSNNNELCVIKSIVNPPISLFYSSLSTDTKNWQNECVAQHYGIKKVKVEE